MLKKCNTIEEGRENHAETETQKFGALISLEMPLISNSEDTLGIQKGDH